jgi:hypothetical protein
MSEDNGIDFAAFVERKHRAEGPPVETESLTLNQVKTELQLINLRLEQMYEERVKLESRRERLQSRLLEVTDRALEIERARELASRVSMVKVPRVTHRCRYCFRHTRRLYGAIPVCDECREQIEFMNLANEIDEGLESSLEEKPTDAQHS